MVYPFRLKQLIFGIFLISAFSLSAQHDSTQNKLEFSADFRFRIEQDWNSRRQDGTYRSDRTRLRYRARFGFNYQLSQSISFGMRVRTGNPKKQQDPQITLGAGSQEFGTVPLGLENLYFDYQKNGYQIWLGKNQFPFRKNNELFWSDNVYPDGVFLGKDIILNSGFFENLILGAGHFIIKANGTSLDQDSFLEGIQAALSLFDSRVIVFPSYYYFNHIPDIPDGFETFFIDYEIFHTGMKIDLLEKPLVNLEFDFYQNLNNYDAEDSIANSLKNEKKGFVTGINIGELRKKSDWNVKLTYNHLEQFAAVDFLTQNDWARWDYSGFGSPDGRLTNYRGFEVVGSYLVDDKLKLTVKYYQIKQLVAYGSAKETNARIRFDVDIWF